ncbi:hypothetical protein C3458_15280 [Serratia marcescens]|uniref:hypothetical protein n=1 Tax=Serratia marcescens TaxID=615 RepID=UPI000CDE4D96|nr:hypothetical protein [Serratia marcescens]POW86616.1 hypothetical protein C3461_14050 [Serratia marcescens]POW91116.1 hypothetical protein C3459_15270 [Serratia marcescens]POX05264.1 hypothetical protein C3458_15280 [Serratia marcescens]POX11535.1 hypothetical protein C3725_04565 [Serratia marcescens]
MSINNNRAERLFEIVKTLWLDNQLREDDFNNLVDKIKSGNYDDAERTLALIGNIDSAKEILKNNKPIHSTDEIVQNIKLRRKNNQHQKEADGILSSYNDLNEINFNFLSENERFKETIERLKLENKALKDAISSYEFENKNIKSTINKIQKENLELKNKHQQSRIDEKIPDYVKDVSQKLDVADKFFSDMSRNWSIAGLILALCAVASAFCTFIFGLDTILNAKELTPTAILYTFIRGGLGIALLSWVSYISFSNARNYTHESILRKDRQHALTFGRLFLQIYGSTASKEDAIHVFKDWNMSGDTAFSSKSSTPPSPLSYFDSAKNLLSKATSTTKNADKINE